MIEVVAAGVIDGKIDTDASCIAPASASRCSTGRRPVWIAGQTTCGVAASMTTSRTFRLVFLLPDQSSTRLGGHTTVSWRFA